jgi:hypothetical protein
VCFEFAGIQTANHPTAKEFQQIAESYEHLTDAPKDNLDHLKHAADQQDQSLD